MAGGPSYPDSRFNRCQTNTKSRRYYPGHQTRVLMEASGQLEICVEETNQLEEWGEDEEGYDENDDEDAEAEEIARRLGDQLWADINKAQADRAGTTTSVSISASISPSHSTTGTCSLGGNTVNPVVGPLSHHVSKQEEAAITTMKAILSYAAKDPLAFSTLSSTLVPDSNGESVLDVLNRLVTSRTIPKEIAKPLSRLILSLARSDTLFATLRHSNTSAAPDDGKRKRDEGDEASQYSEAHHSKRGFFPHSELQTQIQEAVRIVTQALSANSFNHSTNPSLISSIQLQLHQIFLFAVTSSARGGTEMSALQEISGLIQVVGVLSGIRIGPTPDSEAHGPTPSGSTWLPTSVQITDIGTAVYPCLVPACHKVFSRLYSLRAHQRMHAVHRPFRCSTCPASFARNHDLKRHAKLHDKAWKCCGCDKMFSRRDAIKRHKKSNRTRGSKGEACINAEVVEVDLDKQEGDEIVKEGRRAKMWNGIVGGHSGTTGYGGYSEDRNVEEGEVEGEVIARAQSAIVNLHGLLQAYVANVLGIPSGESSSQDIDPAAGQATLASVIARVQLQNLPLRFPQQGQQPELVTRSAAPPATAISDNSHQAPHQQGHIPGSAGIPTVPSLSRYGLSEEQTTMLEQAIANAASAAQAQAEAEAALEEEEEAYDDEDGCDMINEEDDGMDPGPGIS